MRIRGNRDRRSQGARGVILVAALLAVSILLILTPGVSSAEEASTEDAPEEDAPILNIGHRGAAGLAPEHTFASYDLALELGADYIEQDLRMTRDGVLVVLHDEDLDRTTRGPAQNCTGSVSEKTLAQEGPSLRGYSRTPGPLETGLTRCRDGDSESRPAIACF